MLLDIAGFGFSLRYIPGMEIKYYILRYHISHVELYGMEICSEGRKPRNSCVIMSS
jgi:hypothetical protein